MCEEETFIPVAAAARLLATTELRILMMLKNNELQGKLTNETWYVQKASLQLCGKPKASDIVRPGGCGSGCGGGCAGH
jgi:hypothetical protein